MTKEQIFKLINGMQNPVMYLATSENGQPHVRAVLLYSADENGIVFHTGKFKELHKQLQENPKAEACFATGKYQVRVEGEFKLVDDIEFKKEIINHPSRKFLQGWIAEQGLDAVIDFIQVYRMEHGKAHTWSFEDNFKAKEYVDL